MREESLRYKVFPQIVRADQKTKIRIEATDDYRKFRDDVTYKIRIFPYEYHQRPINEEFTLDGYFPGVATYEMKGKDGVIEFEHYFDNEQKWEMILYYGAEQYDHLNYVRYGYEKYWDNHELEHGDCRLFIYSLKEDLYKRRPLKGDLHLHSVYSDGNENPEVVCANLRRMGRDFCVITDHRNYDGSVRAVEKMQELDTGFETFYGEEVHENFDGRIHIVNFNGKKSINKYIMDNYDEFMKEVKAEEKKHDMPYEMEARQLAFHKVITDKIREVGGISILAHPFWECVRTYNTPTNVIYAIIENGYFDAFEVLGGILPEYNNLQTAMYYEMRAKGYKIPVVGSTDSHSSIITGKNEAGKAYTICFSDGDIQKSIMDNYSMAVESLQGETLKSHGEFRLVDYAQFLNTHYFPYHDRMCESSGIMMHEYYTGHKELKPAIELMEKRIKEYEDDFFGRK